MNKNLKNKLKRDIGLLIQRKREENGLTRNELLDLVGISLNSLSSIENGQTLIKLDTLIEITNALGISLETFFMCLKR